ncbi:hypothetical protein BGW37DRAFT_191524 [Umbelopsis sp. PMI_123]|nr:hypothetical protein BGW37DRAFT_191524 [Umbelopsis sp. PMI_123]
MTDMFWNAVLTGAVLASSSIALSMQKVIQGKTRSVEDAGTKTDISDPSYEFSDSERQKRLVPATLIIATWRLAEFIYHFQSLVRNISDEMLTTLIQEACLVIGWMYALVLAVLSWYHRLPDKWVWILNIHLSVFYFTTFIGHSYSLGRLALLPREVSALYVAGAFFIWMINFDLLFVTSTTRRGPPTIDKHGRPIQLGQTTSFLAQ